MWRRRRLAAITGTPLLIVFGFLAWGLGSPLFISETVEEEFPFAYTAVVPADMEMEDIEMTMAVVAAMDDEPMMEAMPKMMMEEEEGGEAVMLKTGKLQGRRQLSPRERQGHHIRGPGRQPSAQT